MRSSFKFLMFLAFFSLLTIEATAQEAGARNATMNPCPGGVSRITLEEDVPSSLSGLVYVSDLIVIGTITNVQPAVLSAPQELNSRQRSPSIETHSEVSIKNVLFGALPSGVNSILIVQRGGTVGPCTTVVPEDPLVKFNEDYVLFLKVDKRTYPPSTVQLPRYFPVGAANGKAKIVDAKIQLLPATTGDIRKSDQTDADVFVSSVQKLISSIYPKGVKRPTTNILPPITPPTRSNQPFPFPPSDGRH